MIPFSFSYKTSGLFFLPSPSKYGVSLKALMDFVNTYLYLCLPCKYQVGGFWDRGFSGSCLFRILKWQWTKFFRSCKAVNYSDTDSWKKVFPCKTFLILTHLSCLFKGPIFLTVRSSFGFDTCA